MTTEWITFEPDAALAQDMPVPAGQSTDAVFSENDLKRGEPGLVLAGLQDREGFSAFRRMRTESFIVKEPGALTHRLPKGYSQFKEALQLAAAFEAAHGDFFSAPAGDFDDPPVTS